MFPRSVGLLPESYPRDVITLSSGGEYDPYRTTFSSRASSTGGGSFAKLFSHVYTIDDFD